jgi:hypothetical protein
MSQEQDDTDEHRAEARPDAPAIPPTPPWGILRDPIPIVDEGQYTLGWQNARKVGPCFVMIRLGAIGARRVLERFPMTEEGWASAWSALVNVDPDAARRILCQGTLGSARWRP